MNGIVRIALYARVSSQKQAEEKTIKSQRQDILQRIERDELHIASDYEFCDDGYSGSELLRPALETLRDRIASSLIDRLYIHSPDRLARKFAHQALLLEEFKKHRCEVIFLNQEGLPESPEANLLIQMQGMIAEYEREKILERTRRGRRYAATRGSMSVFGRAPYGYQYVSKAAGGGEARWDVDPRESETVRLMFELVGERGFSLGAVCRELGSRGIETKKGNRCWHCATVRGILTNPAYYGQAKYGKQRLIARKPGKRAKRGDPVVPRQARVAVATPAEDQITVTVPAIISKTLFEQVGRQMAENQKRQRERSDGAKYLLSGLLLCGHCGSAYCARRPPGGKYIYYRCIGTDRYRRGGKAICNNRSVKGVPVEERVWAELCKLLQDPSRLQAELHRRRSEESVASNEVPETQRRIDDLRGRLDRLIDAYSTGLLEKSEFESRIRPLRDQHDREVSALASLRGLLNDESDAASAKRTLSQLSEQIGGRLEAASESLKRELLVLLIKRIEVYQDEIRIVYKVPQSPFVLSPVSRGFLQHRLQCPVAAPRQRTPRPLTPLRPVSLSRRRFACGPAPVRSIRG